MNKRSTTTTREEWIDAFVKHVAEEVARLREIPYEEVAERTTENFFRLFRGARPA